MDVAVLGAGQWGRTAVASCVQADPDAGRSTDAANTVLDCIDPFGRPLYAGPAREPAAYADR